MGESRSQKGKEEVVAVCRIVCKIRVWQLKLTQFTQHLIYCRLQEPDHIFALTEWTRSLLSDNLFHRRCCIFVYPSFLFWQGIPVAPEQTRINHLSCKRTRLFIQVA